jgi:basic amino acid/polyamine antiporter, APA family
VRIWHPRTRTPATALIYQGVVSAALTFTGSYSGPPTYAMFASVLFTGLMVAAVYRLRVKRPDLPRSYRCWGYPAAPALYLAMRLAFLVYVVEGNPLGSAIGGLLILAGVPFYAIWRASGGATRGR